MRIICASNSLAGWIHPRHLFLVINIGGLVRIVITHLFLVTVTVKSISVNIIVSHSIEGRQAQTCMSTVVFNQKHISSVINVAYQRIYQTVLQ